METKEEESFYNREPELKVIARNKGLEFSDIDWNIVPQDIMAEVAAYGLPTRARHWSYGKVYQSQRIYGNMGLTKIYEIVLNNEPPMAFLLDSNPEIANLLVAAHVFGHADFFKNNVLFSTTNRKMINSGEASAKLIDKYIERHGLDIVEHIMDIGFALDRHIDTHRGEERELYAPRRVVEKERPGMPYDDLHKKPERSLVYDVEGEKIPPHPERDLLWFLINYADFEEWKREVLSIIRAESYYFYPQFITKIMNEGWASFWHAEIFNEWSEVRPTEMIEFAKLHAGVVNPGSRLQINPYYLGFKILKDIERRWDEKKEKGESHIGGREKIFQARKEEDDPSFLRNYLTEDLVRDLELFTIGTVCEHPKNQRCSNCDKVVITSRERDAVVESLLAPRYNYGMPQIVVTDSSAINKHLYLEHVDRKDTFLDRRFANMTLSYIKELWQHPVHLLTSDESGTDVSISVN